MTRTVVATTTATQAVSRQVRQDPASVVGRKIKEKSGNHFQLYRCL